MVSIVSLSFCYVIASFLLGFSCLLHCLFRHYYYIFKISIVSLSVCYVTALFSASIVLSSVCYVTILSLQGFHYFNICLFDHCIVSSSACYLTLSLSFRLELIPPRGGVSHADPPSPLVSIISVFFL